MKIVLVYPDHTNLEELTAYTPFPIASTTMKPYTQPLGMLYLISNLVYPVTFIDNSIRHLNDNELIREIHNNNPDIVGFGGTCLEYPQARRVAQNLKIPTIYGGPNAMARSEKHIKYFDYVLRGEGEYALNSLLSYLEKGKKPKTLGVWTKKRKNEDGKFESELDNFAFPWRGNITDYKRQIGFTNRTPCDVVMSSRGCPFNCHFCSSMFKKHYHQRTPENVIKEIKKLIENYGTQAVWFCEDNFTVNKRWVRELCKLIKPLNLDWFTQGRSNSVDIETLEIMKDAGCKKISFGFESVNESTLNYINKGITAEQNKRAVEICETVKMNWTAGLMVGVLNEGKREIDNTFRFAEELKKKSHCIYIQIARFYGIPVAKTYLEMIDKGLVGFNWQDGELLIAGTYHLTAKQVDKIMMEHLWFKRLAAKYIPRFLWKLRKRIKKGKW